MQCLASEQLEHPSLSASGHKRGGDKGFVMVTVKDSHVEFQFFRPGAHRVTVVGDFTGWREDQVPMQKTPDGCWHASIRLPGGCFRFRYIADGQWYTDYAAFGIEPGPFGPVGIVYVPSGPHIQSEETPCLPARSQKN